LGGHDAPGFHEPGPNESVVKRFTRFPNVDVVRGIIPDSFAQAAPDTIAFLHIDLNSSKAEIATLDILFDWISPGGLVVFDDYGWNG
jgi:O-methyltransferase